MRGALFVAFLALLALPAGALAQSRLQLTGIVVDVTGAVVSGAEVSTNGGVDTTDEHGRFHLPVHASEVLLHVHAAGFADYTGRVRSGRPVRIVLHPSGFAESVTVTAGPADRLANTAAAVSVVSSAALLTSAAMTIDDALRGVPGFSLFRRSSSRVANPTTQGVTMRGLAASGASRALVLADGVPINDPYGGWVYWDRVPQAAIDRVEVVRGSGGEGVHGLDAIGGTLEVSTLQPRTAGARLSLEGGQHGMARASGYAGARRAEWDGFAAGERYTLDGFPIVAPDERGAIDENAGLRYGNALTSLGWTRDTWGIDARANWLDENRANGTPFQRNDTNLWSVALGGRGSGFGGLFTCAAYLGETDYDQSFSSVTADRTTERLTSRQRVASENSGGSLQWVRQSSTWNVLVGGEARRVSGGGSEVDSGTQRDTAAYAQLGWDVARLKITAGLRAGLWSTAPENPVDTRRRTSYLVPRLSLTWSHTPSLSWTASWSSPARTPTLNELYRNFQVGNVLTYHNAGLVPEDAQAVEAGLIARHGAATGRIVGFWTTIDDAIANVTLSASDTQIVRQRRNAGTVRARGIEAEGEWRPAAWASIIAALALTDSRFGSSDEPGLTGKRVSQVPRWQTGLSARVTRGRGVVSLDWRSTGAQFDDDRNQFVLRQARVLDLYVGASLGRGVQPFMAVENLFDAEVDVGRTPVRTVGTPKSVRVGVRLLLQ